MSDIYWAKPKSGQFNVGSNWVGGVEPGGQDNAFLGAGDYTVRVTVSDNIGALNVSTGVTLDVRGQGVRLGSFRGDSTNAGIIDISNSGDLLLASSIVNSGIISIGHGTLITSYLQLNGGGTVRFDSLGHISDIKGEGGPGGLDNVDNTITTGTGNGVIGAFQAFTNEAAGKVIQTGLHTLRINTGRQTVVNDGLFESKGTGGFTIANALENNGAVESVGGKIVVKGAVSGTGAVIIDGGSVAFQGAFSEAVSFGATGTLLLSQATGFNATVTGFSAGTAFDLTDIGFVGVGEATFSGNASGGALTVTDGIHTARIALTGDYLGATFSAASDNNGGVVVTESLPGIHRFIAAAASLASAAGASTHFAPMWVVGAPPLARPHFALA